MQNKKNLSTFIKIGLITALFIALNFSHVLAVTTTTKKTSPSTAICTPTLKIQKIKETEIIIKATCANLISKKTDLKFEITNEDDDKTSTRTFSKVTFGKNGNTEIKIDKLNSLTNYSFKAKIKQTNNSKTEFSKSVEAKTKGLDYKPTIDAVKNIGKNSLDLRISCDDLKKQSVNIQLEYKKKTDWTSKNYSLTLDSDGEGLINVTNLVSDVDYTFRIKIKKSSDKTYSAYSSTKTATTDN